MITCACGAKVHEKSIVFFGTSVIIYVLSLMMALVMTLMIGTSRGAWLVSLCLLVAAVDARASRVFVDFKISVVDLCACCLPPYFSLSMTLGHGLHALCARNTYHIVHAPVVPT